MVDGDFSLIIIGNQYLKYADCGGIDFAMFANKEDAFMFMLHWK